LRCCNMSAASQRYCNKRRALHCHERLIALFSPFRSGPSGFHPSTLHKPVQGRGGQHREKAVSFECQAATCAEFSMGCAFGRRRIT
jgi:hypothetical protein